MPQPDAQNATATAADFLTRCFAPGESIALLLRDEDPAATMQRIVQLEIALAPRYLAWLAHENAAGSNVYVAANPLRSDSRKRAEACIAAVRHLYLDLDNDAEARLTTLLASHAVPIPNAVLSTSLGKYQILWRVDGFTPEQQESVLKLLAIIFGGDPACTDCNGVVGFLNCKYDPAYRITVEYVTDSTWNCDDFRLDILAADAVLPSRAITTRKHPSNHSNSEHDWAGALRELAQGKDAANLTRKLASRRTDKPNPLYYAQGTVDVASAKLWLIKGVPIDDVARCLKSAAALRFPSHSAALVRGRLPRRR